MQNKNRSIFERNFLAKKSDLAVDYLPGPIGLATGDAGPGLRAAINIDCLFELTAVLSGIVLIGAGRCHCAPIAAIRVVPAGRLAGRIFFQR